MKKVSLSGSPRKNVGKQDAVSLRREGRVPAVLYGGKEQTSFHISEIETNKIVFTPNVFIVELDIEGTKKQAIVKEIQQHPVSDKVIHVDFLEIFDDKPLKIKLPVSLVGTPIGVRNGGKLSTPYRSIKVEALPPALPDAIELKVEDVRIGQAIRISDINIEGVNFLEADNAVVVAVKTARGAVEEEDETAEGEGEEKAAE